jgi:hypothetical protein
MLTRPRCAVLPTFSHSRATASPAGLNQQEPDQLPECWLSVLGVLVAVDVVEHGPSDTDGRF